MNTDKLFPNLTIVSLLNHFHEAKFDLSTVNNYMISYQAFLNYFRSIKEREERITKNDLIIGINFTYGWMPTVFSFKTNEFEHPIYILNQVLNGSSVGTKEFTALRSLFNNSIVGTSKLLHFIDPDNYAIWDSRVCRFATGRDRVYQAQVNNIEHYERYLNLSRAISSEPLFTYQIYEPFCKQINEHQQINFPITPLRALELLVFLLDIKNHGQEENSSIAAE